MYTLLAGGNVVNVERIALHHSATNAVSDHRACKWVCSDVLKLLAHRRQKGGAEPRLLLVPTERLSQITFCFGRDHQLMKGHSLVPEDALLHLLPSAAFTGVCCGSLGAPEQLLLLVW